MGKINDVIEFEGHSAKDKGVGNYYGYDALFYIVYWHEYLMSNDDGINRQIFVEEDKLENQDEVISKSIETERV